VIMKNIMPLWSGRGPKPRQSWRASWSGRGPRTRRSQRTAWLRRRARVGWSWRASQWGGGLRAGNHEKHHDHEHHKTTSAIAKHQKRKSQVHD
jgi:hypothetical protein